MIATRARGRRRGWRRRPCWPRTRSRVVVPEPDEQVRREADALPPDVQEQVAVGEDEQQHRRDEEVQVREEPPPVGVVLHVRDRVHVDERPDEGHEQHEGQRQRVEQQARVELNVPRGDPGEQVHVDRTRSAGCPGWITSRALRRSEATAATPSQWPQRSGGGRRAAAPPPRAGRARGPTPRDCRRRRQLVQRRDARRVGTIEAASGRPSDVTPGHLSVLQQVGVVDGGRPRECGRWS